MIAADLLDILRCPQTGQTLALAGPELLARANAWISEDCAGGDATADATGTPVREPLSAALVRADGQLLYPVRDNIPVLLIEEAIKV